MSAPRKGFRTCKRCGRNRAERFFVGQRGTVCQSCRTRRGRVAARSVRLSDTYGISSEEYAALLAAQGGVCSICQGERRYNLDVDHDHALERALVVSGTPAREATRLSIRGLLCKNCNRGILRKARDNPTVLRAAADYLEGGTQHARRILYP